MLGQLIEYLDDHKRSFYNFSISKPHSWRGSYYELAVVVNDVPSYGAEIREVLLSALDQTYEGYKGNDFTMDAGVEVYLEPYAYAYAYEGQSLTVWLLEHTQIG